MARAFGNMAQVLGASWRVLRNDRLVKFPLALGVSLLIVLFYVLMAFNYAGTFDRLTHGFSILPADLVFLGLSYFGAVFVIAYFTAALVAAEQYRVVGGTPDFRYGLEAANDRLGAITLWSAIAGTLGVALRRFAPSHSRRSGGLLWGGATFLVIPVMIVEGSPPLESMRRSAELFEETWGRKFVRGFGFGPLYLATLLGSILLAVSLYFVAGMTIAVLSAVVAFALVSATVKCLEAVFLVALYNYAAAGKLDGWFAEDVLGGAEVVRRMRGIAVPQPPARRAAA